MIIFYDHTSHFVVHTLHFKTHYNIGTTLNLKAVIPKLRRDQRKITKIMGNVYDNNNNKELNIPPNI